MNRANKIKNKREPNQGFILLETLISITLISLIVLAHLTLIIQSESFKNRLKKQVQLHRRITNWSLQDLRNATCTQGSLLTTCTLKTEQGSKTFISFTKRLL